MSRVCGLLLFLFLSGNALPSVAGSAKPTDKISGFVLTTHDLQCDRPKENYIEVDHTRFRYVDYGTGPAVVLIHGNAGSIEEFDFKSLGPLCRDHRVIAFDRPGHGKSARPADLDATLEVQTRLLHESLSDLGVTQPVLVGHSWGGSLALAYALQYPNEVSGIVLLAPAAYPDGGADEFMRAWLKTPVVGDVSLTLGRLLVGKHLLKKELKRAFYPDDVPEDYLRHASSSWLHHKQMRAILEDEWSLDKDVSKTSKHYSDIRIPVVIVTGDHDKVVSPRDNAFRLKSSIAQSQLIELKNTGHQVPQTHPESIYNAVSLIPKAAAQRRWSDGAAQVDHP
jgi:pimeloyl-ACP methyl ester carboxylesterase